MTKNFIKTAVYLETEPFPKKIVLISIANAYKNMSFRKDFYMIVYQHSPRKSFGVYRYIILSNQLQFITLHGFREVFFHAKYYISNLFLR